MEKHPRTCSCNIIVNKNIVYFIIQFWFIILFIAIDLNQYSQLICINWFESINYSGGRIKQSDMDTFSESINQLRTFVSELPSEYIATVLISLLIIIAITLIALIVGKKNVDID